MLKEDLRGYRLSPQQSRLWLLEQRGATSGYTAKCLCMIAGDLDLNRLEAALRNVVARHEILRTTFDYLPGMPVPLQAPADETSLTIECSELCGRTPEEQRSEIDSLFRRISDEPVELEKGPVLRVKLIKLSAESHAMMLCLPALCADRTTLVNIVSEACELYCGRDFTEEVVQYVDCSEWLMICSKTRKADRGASIGKRKTSRSSASRCSHPRPSQLIRTSTRRS